MWCVMPLYAEDAVTRLWRVMAAKAGSGFKCKMLSGFAALMTLTFRKAR